MVLAGVLAGCAPVGAQTLSAISFGAQAENTTSAAKSATLKNTGTTSMTISGITVTGNFAKAGGTCTSTLAKGASCTILVTFTPLSLGALTGTLTVTDNAANSPQTSKLSGTGVAPVTVSPTSLTFSKLPIGEVSAPKPVTLTNNLNVALSFNNIATTGDFAVASNTCSPSIPAAPATCTVGITFSPTATGTRSGSLKFSDNASNSPQAVTLTGTGSAAVLLSIAVTPVNATIYTSTTQQYTATGTYSDGSTKVLTAATWSAAPSTVASITSTGLATGLATGTATITATAGTINGSTGVTVLQAFLNTGSLNTGRYYHTATLLTNGSVLVAGGIGPIPGGTGALGTLASAELYSPGTQAFTFTGNLVYARDEHTATLLNNGNVLVVGGVGLNGILANCEFYNPATALFTVTAILHVARYSHAAAILPGGSVLVAGGYGSAGVLNSAEVYNPTGIFTATALLNQARFDATATPLPDGTVLIAGGANSTGALASAEIYDPVAGTFTLLTNSLNVARSGATATLLNNGQVLIAGGYNYLVTGPLTSAELYDPTAQTFTLTGSEPTSGWLGTATLLGNGGVLMAGSVIGAADAELYSAFAGTFANAAPLNTPGDLQTATLMSNGTVLVAGGHSNTGGTVLAAAELYEPSTLSPANLVSIAISPASASVAVGASQQLVATGTFSDSSTQVLASVSWTSSNPAVATITNDQTNSGVVYGVATGSALVSACAGTICQTAATTVQ